MRTKRTVQVHREASGRWSATGTDGQLIRIERRHATRGKKLHTWWIAEPPGLVARTFELLLADLVRQGILEAE